MNELVGSLSFLAGADDLAQRRIARDRRRRAEAQLAAEQRVSEQPGMASHELRNSLGALRNGLRRLERRRELTSVAEVKLLIDGQVVQMSRLIDDLMEVSQIPSGVLCLRKERIDLGVVVTNAIGILRPDIDRRRQRLVVERPKTTILLDADPARLQQVLTNLLSNAVKFTGDGGELRLTVERDSAWVTVRIADTGIGIASRELPYVFQAFRQVNSSCPCACAGFGIGLSVVHDVVERHGGRVVATSAGLGKGSEFSFRLPALPRSTRMNRN
jgi:signal transduction histidine kinase